MPARPPYASLYFGKSDSRNEAADNPTEFIRSYVNLNNALDAVVGGRKFLVLGPKGTGKSAMAWFLKATQSPTGHSVMIRDASTLPLADVPRMLTGQPSGPERTVTAWTFILLCNYLELLLKDPSSSLHLDAEVDRVVGALRDYGFVGDASGKALLNASTSTYRVPIPTVGNIYQRENSPALNIFNVIPYLERWACIAKSDSRPILLLDGLDSIFLNDNKYDKSLASLVQAAFNLNQSLQHANAEGSIVLLLRNDVFSRVALSLPDSQKMRDDQSLQLDWRVLSGHAGIHSPLMQLVNSKAAKALDVPFVDVLSYFRKDVQLGPKGSAPTWKPTLPYLLNLTRHTPRDLLRLFESIREVQAAQTAQIRDQRWISEAVIREGVQRYSSDYFVGAIKNEFAGFEDGADASSAALTALKHIGKGRFTRKEFDAALKEELDNVTQSVTNRLLKLLFFAGAVGNQVSTRNNDRYLQFYHRRDDVEIYLNGQFVLANPLTYAWSLPF